MQRPNRTQEVRPRLRTISRTRNHALGVVLVWILIMGTSDLAPAAPNPIFALARDKQIWQAAELARTRDPLTRMKLRISSGNIHPAEHEIEALRKRGMAGRLALLQLAFARHDLEALADGLAAIKDESTVGIRGATPTSEIPDLSAPEKRELLYRWDFMIEDFASVESRCGRIDDPLPTAWEDLYARADLAFRTIRVSRARRLFSEALKWAPNRRDRSRALYGLARVEYNDLNFSTALEKLEEALNLTPLFANAWHQYGRTLIRLGRTSEAVESFEMAVQIAPNHEGAHYALGNGYALLNYTQLFARYPDQFLEPHPLFVRADSLLRAGETDRAKAQYQSLARDFPRRADLHLRFGSLAFSRGDWVLARKEFGLALEQVPSYGRAHNGLAKTLEAERASRHPRRSADEEAFARVTVPDLPGISEYVLNWDALSARHQKRVALSVAPWGRFLPVLLAGGATHYIKPLHERLSETPGQNTLADARISYDSRLWDDVRGCGGHHTVTGIEDVERSVVGRYNTVLHELTHQIHGVLPAARRRRIDELYWQAKARSDEHGNAFLSRYAGGSSWEYFAEGANALMTPTRGQFDTREITRERLDEIDPQLRDLVREILQRSDIDSSYAVALANKGTEELRSGNTAAALRSLGAALRRNPDEPAALRGRTEALLRAGRISEAEEQSVQARSKFPEDGDFVILAAESRLLAGATFTEVLNHLESHRSQLRSDDLPALDLAVGGYAWLSGDAELALAAYERVLVAQRDDPSGLWGRATAHALAGSWERSWTDYEAAIELRTGRIELRCDYARDLLHAKIFDRAREQIDAARLLDATSPRARALLAWWHLEQNNLSLATETASKVLEDDSTIDLARLVAARSSGNKEWITELTQERPAPWYIFDPGHGSYRLAGLRSALEEQLLREWFPD